MNQLIRPTHSSSKTAQQLAPSEDEQVGSEEGPVPNTDRGRVMILIDGANLFYASMQLSIDIDYVKLLSRLTNGGRLVHAFFYTGVDPINDKQKGFLHWMQCHGYRVIAKELIQFPDGSRKANLNVEIAIDMMKLVGCCDTVVLLSGTGELAYAVNFITYQGIRTEVVCLRSMTSDSLINVSDTYVDLGSIKQDIQKMPAAKRVAS